MIEHTLPLTILQYNAGGSPTVQTAFLHQSDPQQNLFIFIQEPWINTTTRTSIKDPRYHQLIQHHHQNPRICVYISKVLPTNSWQTTHHSNLLSTTTITTAPTLIRMHNYYNPPAPYNNRDPGPLAQLPDLLGMAGQHILLGDFNLHHPLWGGDSVTSSHEMAHTLIQHTITAGLSLTLPAGTKTREASGSSSTLDLVFMSQWLKERLWHCSVDKTIDTGSDHWPIRTTIKQTRQPSPFHLSARSGKRQTGRRRGPLLGPIWTLRSHTP
jgi:endonuclease/exonuclease/phosphatase family metal-dependent hydrolase